MTQSKFSTGTVLSNKSDDKGGRVLDLVNMDLYAHHPDEFESVIKRSRGVKRYQVKIIDGVVHCDDDQVRKGLERRFAKAPDLMTHEHGFTFKIGD